METKYSQKKKSFLQEFKKLLSFETIGADPACENAMHLCAHYLQERLTALGLESQLINTPNHPLVFGSNCTAGADKPTLLLYQHYDVQPVDPLELWDTPPFAPTIKDHRIFARGAQDNKGQLQYVLQALELFDKKFPINIKILIEGDEETGSFGLSSILEREKELFKADFLSVIDVGMKAKDIPAVTLGVRGIATFEISIFGPKMDLHSGSYGGIVKNPLQVLSALLASAYKEDGSIAIPGFYEDVEEVDKEPLDFSFDENFSKKITGVDALGGEQAYTPLERAWLRPTLEINGMHGGYTGQGFKTIIPSSAHAKVSIRLVKGQEPQKMLQLVKDFFKKCCPEGVSIEINLHKGGGRACQACPTSLFTQAVKEAFSEVFKAPCSLILEGGSIPITTALAEASKAEPLFFGLGLLEDNIHAPNENFSLDRLEKGTYIVVKLLEKLKKAFL
jgi:acetylornithine deacetylase/succinyl-diaminopimelate desuccinylase-like protein